MTEQAAMPIPAGGVLFPRAAFVIALVLGQDVGTEVERAAAAALAHDAPDCVVAFQNADLFRQRALRQMAAHGVGQVVIVGGGMSTPPAARDLARQISAGTRVVFVDDDPDITGFLSERLRGQDTAAAITADLTDPDAVFDHPGLTGLLNLREPVGLLLVGIVDRLAGQVDTLPMLAHYILRMPAGSLLAATTTTLDGMSPAEGARWQQHVRVHGLPDGQMSRDDFAAHLEDLHLLPPGITAARDWLPGPRTNPSSSAVPRVYAAIGHVR